MNCRSFVICLHIVREYVRETLFSSIYGKTLTYTMILKSMKQGSWTKKMYLSLSVRCLITVRPLNVHGVLRFSRYKRVRL